MVIILYPGEVLVVQLAGADGEFIIDYDSKKDSTLTVSSDLPDTSGREGIIYCEDWKLTPEDQMEVEEESNVLVSH